MTGIPKVSVRIVTFNHEKFIAQAIESVLKQVVNFHYEIVIGEDASNDRTRDILLEYKKKHPQGIRLLLHEKNIGHLKNSRQTLAQCAGEYITILDGDDYWTDDGKLQRQVDFLNQHPEFTLCGHNALYVYETGRADRLYIDADIKPILGLEDLLYYNFLPSGSLMFRNGVVKKYPEIFKRIPFGDWPLQILCATKGKIGYINEIMSAYRIHDAGIWSGRGKRSHERSIKQAEWDIVFYRVINEFLEFKYDALIKAEIKKRKKHLRTLQKERFKEKLVSLSSLGHKIYRRIRKSYQEKKAPSHD